jgi:hypothetical protein
MLKVKLKTPNGTESLPYDLSNQMQEMLHQCVAYNISPSWALRVHELKKGSGGIRLYADSDVGKGLIAILDDNETLYDIGTLDESLASVPEKLRDELEQNLLYGQYGSVNEMISDIKAMTKELASAKMSFFCPLTAYINDNNGEYTDASNHILVENNDKIAEAIAAEQATELRMAEYVGNQAELGNKLVFAEWGVEEVQGVLYGRIDCYLTEPLHEEEIERLKDAIEGQNSDGLGEGFEQREIYIDEGDLYVSYWNNGDDYFLHTQEEMSMIFSESPGMSYGGPA